MTYPYGCANITDFQYFIYNVMEVPVAALPTTDPVIQEAFCVAKETVTRWLIPHSHLYYNLAVYNFGGDYIINWAQDQTCQTYFADLRKKWNINGFVAGVVSDTTDESTSTSLEVPEAFRNLMVGDLQLLKTPYGRMYLSIAQKLGAVWGLS